MADVRLIDANALKAKLYSLLKIEEAPPMFIEGLETALAVADVATTIDAVPVLHGRWVHDINNLYGCSACLERETMSHRKLKKYCPNCGAKMDGGEVDG